MGFPRQECWNGLSFPPPGDLLDSEIKPSSPVSPALADGFLFTTASPGKDRYHHTNSGGGFSFMVFIKSTRL